MLGRDRVPRETFGFVAPPIYPIDDNLLAPDDVCATSISVKTALNGMQPVNHQQSEALFHVEHPVSARQSVCFYDTAPA